MRWIPVYISLFFMRIMESVKPYFVRANIFIRSMSGILSRSYPNNTVVVGYMDHDPKIGAMRNYYK